MAKFQSDRILSYFRVEWRALLVVTLSGLFYNLGLLSGPWFEGQMTGCLVNILNGTGEYHDMIRLVLGYVGAILIVQGARYIKRFYVRRFANNVKRRMKGILYGNLVVKSRAELQEEGKGDILIKAILDVDDCAEGMRKFTTEIFDTGVALAAYTGMLLRYDWRLSLLCLIFPPISYCIAEKMKNVVQRTGEAYKKESGVLSAATLDRGENAITYRVFGCENNRRNAYEENLNAYEISAVKASIWSTVMPPIYRIISTAGVIFILYFGRRNVVGTGWCTWDIAAFTTFLSCFLKLSVKSSSAAKLFNAVHKAQVSWERIRPLMKSADERENRIVQKPGNLSVDRLSFAYPDGKRILEDISFSAKPGEVIGITGAVASGKSTLGKVFLCEHPYGGSMRFAGLELQTSEDADRKGIVGYMGHDPELFCDTVADNIKLGDSKDCMPYVKAVCLEREVADMEEGVETLIGSGGLRLSGGQAQRLALARILYHRKPLLILDDPFSALDRNTEREVFRNLRNMTKDSVVLLISHRLYLFPELDKVLWLENGCGTFGTHDELIESVPKYAKLYEAQTGGRSGEEQ